MPPVDADAYARLRAYTRLIHSLPVNTFLHHALVSLRRRVFWTILWSPASDDPVTIMAHPLR